MKVNAAALVKRDNEKESEVQKNDEEDIYICPGCDSITYSIAPGRSCYLEDEPI